MYTIGKRRLRKAVIRCLYFGAATSMVVLAISIAMPQAGEAVDVSPDGLLGQLRGYKNQISQVSLDFERTVAMGPLETKDLSYAKAYCEAFVKAEMAEMMREVPEKYRDQVDMEANEQCARDWILPRAIGGHESVQTYHMTFADGAWAGEYQSRSRGLLGRDFVCADGISNEKAIGPNQPLKGKVSRNATDVDAKRAGFSQFAWERILLNSAGFVKAEKTDEGYVLKKNVVQDEKTRLLHEVFLEVLNEADMVPVKYRFYYEEGVAFEYKYEDYQDYGKGLFLPSKITRCIVGLPKRVLPDEAELTKLTKPQLVGLLPISETIQLINVDRKPLLTEADIALDFKQGTEVEVKLGNKTVRRYVQD